jgi:hypothetical protein
MNLPIRLSAPILIFACLSQAAAIAQQRPSQPGPSQQRTVSEPLAWETDPNFVSTHFSGAANCAACHDDLVDDKGQDVSIQHDWSATMMAHAARDPVFQAKFASEVKRNPSLEPVLESKCLHCHAPMASIDAAYDGEGLKLAADGGILDPLNPYHDQAMQGIGCTLCHQIEDNGDLGTATAFSGNFTLPTIDEKPQRSAYGPIASPVGGAMERWTGYRPEHAEHIGSSALCASCHNLHTPVVAVDGSVTGHEFPEQAVYSEWQQSDYADVGATPASCQDCHMQRADGVRVANRPGSLEPRDGFARHTFAGANTVVLGILDQNRDALGVTATHLADAIEANRAFLRGAARLELVSVERDAASLTVGVRIINAAGHKLPTGFPSRRAWLDFAVKDASGQLLFRSGAVGEDGRITGVDDRTMPLGYSPHHDLIQWPGQVQVYESAMHDTDGAPTHTLLHAAGYLKDNRLLPAGFDTAAATDDTRVVGRAATDPDFTSGSDIVTYRVPVTARGDLHVDVALHYQPLSAGFLDDLFRDADLPLVKRLREFWDGAAFRTETLAETGVIVSG